MIKAKNLETGNIANQGDKFLQQQSKPYIGKNGKMYPDGVWVEYKGPDLSVEAKKVIEDAQKPAPVTPVAPVIPVAPVATQPVKAETPVAPKPTEPDKPKA